MQFQRKFLLSIVSLLAGTTFLLAQGIPANCATSKHGHPYQNHTKKAGTKAQAGDKLYTIIDVFVGANLVSSSRTESPGPVMLDVPDPAQFPAGTPLPPLFDALFEGAPGDSMTFYQIIDSTMRAELPAEMQKESSIRFEIVVAKITTRAEIEAKTAAIQARFPVLEAKMKDLAVQYKAGQLNGKLITLPSGLKVLIEEKGTGGPLTKGDQVETHYYGCLTDGKMFDNSFQRGEPLPFALGMGQMIPGYDEGTQQLNHGGKAVFFIPAPLGYGDQAQGAIPANSELIFFVEVL